MMHSHFVYDIVTPTRRLGALTMLVRPARDAELQTCRTLLPQAFPVIGRAPECLVAEQGGSVVAASAMAWVPRGFPVLVHVVSAARHQGIGRALLAAQRDAGRGETPGLRTWSPVPAASPAALFLEACGFQPTSRLQVYDSDPARLGASMTALLARMRPRIPPGAVLVSPRAAPQAALAILLTTHFPLRPPDLAAALDPAAPHAWDPALSLVLMVEGAVAGAVLARQSGATLEVDLNVVDPVFRNGWANVLLVEGVLRQGRAAGLTRLRFLAEAHVRDTINLARRSGGTRLADQLMMALAF